MRQVDINDDDEVKTFALLAAKAFAKNDVLRTFTNGDIEPNCLFAVRWGANKDCVLVLRLHEYAEVLNFTNIIKQEN